MSTQYVKNTDVPNEDSFLWQLGDGWKVSQKTGDVYSPIDTITDEQLGTTLTSISETGKIDIIEYNSYFFVPNKFVSKFIDKKTGKEVEKVTWSVFAFENRVKADKKLADVKKFTGYQPSNTTTATVPNPPSTTPAAGQRTFTAPSTATTSTASPTPITTQYIPRMLPDETITTYTDPKEVDADNKEYIATLQTDGYSFIPASISSETSWTETIYDKDEETGNTVEIGKRRLYLMGRIINVKIADK